MANQKRGRRARSRKPRPQGEKPDKAARQSGAQGASARGGGATSGGATNGGVTSGGVKGAGAGKRTSSQPGRSAITRSFGERPQAPWHPLPVSEVLILVGAVAAFIGLQRGVSHGGPPLFAGLATVGLGTIEVTLREHRGGFRSHTVVLSLLPVIVFHSLVVLVVSIFTRPPQLVNLGLLIVDVPLFVLLFKRLRKTFVDARRTRAFGGR